MEEFKPESRPSILKTEAINLYYGSFHALKNVTVGIPQRAITAIIGPSGCGKSSLLRVFNRLNDLIPGARLEGNVLLGDDPIYSRTMSVETLRKRVGMVFQRPNPFPMSIYENIIFGPKHHGIKNKGELENILHRSLSQVALWEEVKDRLKKSAFELSPGEQQRLCIARALAMEPDVVLMDESCSALDPESTMKIEELMLELKEKYSIVIVTHNMEQALRISDMAAFIMIDDSKAGTLVEFAPTKNMFSSPKDTRTLDYITGRYG
ncbi:MAG: phosphate ABC transporter ATP-binding protein PstB [Oscillospiraceae bacterium]|nr:phosphate ABC transporter ATP-binding protein PstB [Oscillospiraceae bacterium]